VLLEVQTPAKPGHAGEFDFLAGHWRIAHRRLATKADGSSHWDEFEGEASCWSVLNGAASIEELRIPARGFSGMGIRLLDVQRARWADFWVSGRTGVLVPEPMWGGFVGGVGTFIAEDKDDQGPMLVRGIWDRITAQSCRWQQASSRDGGASWVDNWFMDWVRVGATPSPPPAPAAR
jgi:hypothetical protein